MESWTSTRGGQAHVDACVQGEGVKTFDFLVDVVNPEVLFQAQALTQLSGCL